MMPPFEPGTDQRKTLRRHRERGPVRYAYTIKTIAAAAGVSVQTVRRAMSDKLRLDDLAAVAGFICLRRGAIEVMVDADGNVLLGRPRPLVIGEGRP